MKRRDFLKNTMITGGGSLLLNGIPLKSLAQSSLLQLAQSSCNDRVMVVIQLHGGNDGVNTIVPLDQYSLYNSLRSNIALPLSGGGRTLINLDSTLDVADQVGIHPDMGDFKTLYDQGLATVIQGVAYEDLNQSHFRSRDIWFMGGGNNDYYDSGFMGRYLYDKFPGYPDAYPSTEMPDPLGLEIGNGISLAFHTANSIPASISIQDPEAFHDLINGVIGAEGLPPGLIGSSAVPPVSIENTNYAEELRWIMDFEQKSDQYAERLRDVYLAGTNSAGVSYPTSYPFNAPQGSQTNHLANQLKLVARLLSGGCRTKIFLARIGGFDTHAQQVEESDTTMGHHAALLYHISSAVKAFQDDLKGLGLDDRVLTVTMSEFGRRVASNGSFGTDHGTAAPMFVFGKHVNPGVIGTNPDLSDLDNGNLKHQHDYRQVFNDIMVDWMCASPSEEAAINFDPSAVTPKLNIINTDSILHASSNEFFEERYRLDNCYPNPVNNHVHFGYKINDSLHVTLKIFKTNGELVKSIVDETKEPGEHKIKVDLSDLAPGAYFYKLESGRLSATKKLIKN